MKYDSSKKKINNNKCKLNNYNKKKKINLI